MAKYGQYCPIAQALDIVGDRWTLLIIRDMLTGATHFNELERGLPGISRALLSKRLRCLEASGVVEKRRHPSGRKTTEYCLTEAGLGLQSIINSLLGWGTAWAFGDPSPKQLDPVLLLWWMRQRIHFDRLPAGRTVVQFDFRGAQRITYWLVLTREDATICMTDPGYEINVLVCADLATIFKVWMGQLEYDEAVEEGTLKVEASPRLMRAFPTWFKWSMAADTVRAARRAAAGGPAMDHADEARLVPTHPIP
jgi:DNA-binding HxlR family transcriptional regulator